MAALKWAIKTVGTKARDVVCKADYYSVNVNIGECVGGTAGVVVDRYGHVYAGLGIFAGLPGFQVGAYKLNTGRETPSSYQEINSLVTGWSLSGNVGVYGVVSVAVNTSGMGAGAAISSTGGTADMSLTWTGEVPQNAFIESAINHYTLTDGQDLRLYHAAKKLADCWVANIGPGKKAWFDGHQEMEQALVRFGRFVNDVEGHGRGDGYIRLAQFLLESRRGGSQYDQSHLPTVQQYEAVGHAVRAVYFYSAMADIAAENGDPDYQSAVISLWDNMINRKYYVTGGVGSGETSEGFGADYSLPHDAYCESCSSCGLVFFQYKMNLAYHDAKYADLYEETLYNALLGSTDLGGTTFCYTNPLTNTERTLWNQCPCCVANIPRTLLMLPTWTYVKDDKGLYVNLFVGGSVKVEGVAGTDVTMVQRTDYPKSGAISMSVHPAVAKTFTVNVRIPDRKTSALYHAVPEVSGYLSFRVNGELVRPEVKKGYAQITREWRDGDQIDLVLPMQVQRISCDPRVEANRGKVALRYGPLVYNVETADQTAIDKKIGGDPILAEWRDGLLGGVTVLRGKWADGSPMTAIPYYARMNRTNLTVRFSPGGAVVNFAPGAIGGPVTQAVQEPPVPEDNKIYSQTWLRA